MPGFLANPKLILMRNNIIARQDQMPNANFEFATNPTVTTNPIYPNMSWMNTVTGEIFVCTDNTEDQNFWVGNLGTTISIYPTDGLVVHLPLSSIDGTATPDLINGSAYVNNMTSSNLVTVGSGTGMSFNGIDETIDAAVVSVADTKNFTYSMYMIKTVATEQWMFNEGRTTENYSLCGLKPNTVMNTFWRSGAAPNNYVEVNGTININDGLVHHIAYTADGANVRMYVDGVEDGSGAFPTGTLTSDTMGIGAMKRSVLSNFFAGSLRDIRVYNRGLSLSEVQALAGAK